MIRLSDLRKSYDGGETFAVDGVNLDVAEGELLVLLGESGCGKTTTLKMINRLVPLTSGRIEVNGEDITARDPVELRRSIGYVFQGIGLFPHMTIGENIAIVPTLLKWNQAHKQQRVDDLLSLMNLEPEEYRDRLPGQLSGGQRQRIGLARALAARPRIMLMDEPFGALDPLTRDILQDEYTSIHKQLGLTTVMVTHDMTEALLMADRIAAMLGGQILQVGTPHELLTEPQHDYVAQLMEKPKQHADRLEELAGQGGQA
jgi:osmoprotectant transport system ATP-binding protein